MRLIDADRLSEAIYDNVPAPYEEAVWAKEDCLAEIEAAQTVDAVEVVRCRECKYFGVYRYSGNGYCTNDNGYGFPNQKPDDFCFRGERKIMDNA